MPVLTVAYEGRVLTVPILADWTGTLSLSLNFIAGALSRQHHRVELTEGRCFDCGGRTIVPVGFAQGQQVEAGSGPAAAPPAPPRDSSRSRPASGG